MHNKHKCFDLIWWFLTTNNITKFGSEKIHDIMKYVIVKVTKYFEDSWTCHAKED